MKKLIAAAILLAPFAASAEYVDVIELKMTKCTLADYMTIVRDFNAWGKNHGYQAEIAVKVYHADPSTMIWLGRTANAKTAGKAWDTWRNGQADAASEPHRLAKRLMACHEVVGRRAYDTY